ncbi:hypothetical protein A1O1_09062 [Capronia coronata CBS 617.96]|uniref:DNA2/NAM7 helicase-like C-terminal domain-containing protein n=1 Tax=Capronia coronata CBS 617.96 TaxID=1182541 RepID=W9XNW7_9EURO|nr:uncharacterized protein A1O1_09062 [Capronia coronata CBS 617.96]EXJ78661.1 hypothetical protein A1O1_09062 [Capronia coronata CBS 617.96]
MPTAQRNVQRRMRPEISMFIRETIYPKLVDHASIIDLPDVVGMRKNLFWLDHDNLETGQHSEMHHKSHSNVWEGDMVHALVRHIVRQGEYSSTDITVLTPYTGQLQALRSALRADFEIVLSDRDQDVLEKDGFNIAAASTGSEGHVDPSGQRKATLEKKTLSDLLRVATVDNFQGEEAKVVIVSLVRSNKEKKVGFLRTTNRINVLLSRAQHGMYLIGNADTYSNVPMWQKVIDMLRASDSVGNDLALCCPRHKATPIQVSAPEDFPRLSPEGGCQLCGETCPKDYCQQCGLKQDARVDLLEMKAYAEIDVNETPIVVLGCGHFFTAESLDGVVGMHDVYVTNNSGQFSGLADISGALAIKIPQCPDCQCPVRQYVTQRYNRVINRAVIDEMSKRFLVNGKTELGRLEIQVGKLEKELETSRPDITHPIESATEKALIGLAKSNTANRIKSRYVTALSLNRKINSFLQQVADRHQPAHKLHEATIHASRASRSKSNLEEAPASLRIDPAAIPVERDRRITLGGRTLQIEVD